MWQLLFSTFKTAVEVTLLVLLMMSAVEFLNIGSRGRVVNFIKQSSARQVLFSTLLGAIPGCGGGFAAVSLYTHSVIPLGALCAAMIASCGDEAFFLIATSPEKYLTLMAILIPVALVSGAIVGIFSKKGESCSEGLVIHSQDKGHRGNKVKHFIKEHLWHHIIRHHLLSVFLWTFCALLISNILLNYFQLEQIIAANSRYKLIIILLAVAIGFIPQSGPHLIFITLAANGAIPFYVVVVNMISQQGHVSLPLLSHNKRRWIESKLICVAVALATGILSLLIF